MAVAALSEISLTPIFDNNGVLVRNARIYFYRPGTLDPLTVYQDQELGAPHTQPIVTGGSGRVPPVYVGSQAYRVRIFDNANQLVEDIPWLPGATAADGGGGAPVPDTAIRTGDVIWAFSTGTVRDGWVRLNGGSIGNALSGATERANDDAYNLFLHLWGQDMAGLLPITPSRGDSAESDWLANKALALPDARNMVLGGIATMGRPAERRLDGAPFTAGDTDTVGSYGGAATATLTMAQLPAASPVVVDPGHAHAATQAAHSHVLNDPGHFHAITDPGHFHSATQSQHKHGLNDPGHIHGISDPGHTHSVTTFYNESGFTAGAYMAASSTLTRTTSKETTGISILSRTTGITMDYATPAITVAAKATGITINAKTTGITMDAATPAITVQSDLTGITISPLGTGAAHNNTQPTLLGTFYMKL